MKKHLLILSSIFIFVTQMIAQPISEKFYGINGWMPDFVGDGGDPGNFAPFNPIVDGTNPDGRYFSIMNNTSLVNGGIELKLLRYGGTKHDLNSPTSAQYLDFVTSAQNMGAEPLIQIPFMHQFWLDGHVSFTQATSANNIINDPNFSPGLSFNATITQLMNAGVKYFSIGNEPDRYDEVYSITPFTASDIVSYFRPISERIKQIYSAAGNTVYIVGPDLASFNSGLMTEFLGSGNPANDLTVKIPSITSATVYYLDFVSFHTYPFPFLTQNRPTIIDEPGINFESNLTDTKNLIDLLAAPNQNTNIKIGVTELNIDYQNQGSNGKGDLSANSFLAGQWLADMYANSMENGKVAFMVPWSVHQAKGQGTTDDLGILNGDYLGANRPLPRSTYWHTKLMADYFKSSPTATYVSNFYNSNLPAGSLKSFASKVGNQVVVMLMNQEDVGGTTYNYEISTDDLGYSTGSIHIGFSTGKHYLKTGSIPPNETQLIVFNCNQNYAGMWVYNLARYNSDLPPLWTPASPNTDPFTVSIVCGTPCANASGYYSNFSLSGAQNITWMTDPGLTITSSDGSTVHALVGNPSTYTFIATNSNGCVITSGILLNNNAVPVGGGGGGTPAYICDYPTEATCGLDNGTAEVCGTCSPSSVQWDNGETTSRATHLSAGLHTVTVLCGTNTIVLSVVIPSGNSPVFVNAGTDLTFCSGNTVPVQLNASVSGFGPFSYSWAPSSQVSAANIYNPTTNPSVSTNYSVTVTAANGCTAIDQVTVTVVAPPTVSAGPDLEMCQGGSYYLFGSSSGGSSPVYTWSPSTGLSSTNILIPDANPIATTTYTLTVTDANSCSVQDNVTVIINPPVSVTLTASPSTICEGSFTALIANASGGTGSLHYTWSPTTVTYSNPTGDNTNAYPTTTTNFGLLVMDDKGCYKAANQLITVNPIPVVSAIANDEIISKGCTTTLSTNSVSGVTYTWQPGNLSGSSVSVSPISTTTYTVTALNSLGCSATSSVTVTVMPTPFTVTGNTSSCGGTLNYSVSSPITSGVTYTWSTTIGLNGTGSSANVNFGTNGGTITFTGTYAGGCSFSNSLYVGGCCSAGIANFYNTTSASLAPYGTIISGTTYISNQTFSINGTFLVNNNLTLQGCDIRMGYLAKIIVGKGKTLTITNLLNDKSHIYACNEMWDGIYVQSSNEAIIITNGSTIEDAINAVVSENNGNIQITSGSAYGNVIFNKNNTSILVRNSITAYPANINSATFECYDGISGGNPTNTSNKLHYPYSTKRSLCGINITDVNSITIGSTALLTQINTFDNLDFGIIGYNSGVNIYNNNFQNITLPSIFGKDECSPGTAICLSGNPSFAVLNDINIGSVASGGFYKNTFSNCNMGIVATQNLNLKIWRNNFNNINSTAIRALRNYQKDLQINENVINNARLGINCFDNLSSTVKIDNNDINAGALLRAEGILAQEFVAGSTFYTISRNTISNVRNGITGSGLRSSSIDRNNVTIKHTSSATFYCHGIQLLGSSLCNISGNWVMGQNTSDYWVEGILIDLSYSDKVLCNETHNVYSGLFLGGTQTPNTQVAKNEMNNDYQGLVLNYGEIGPQYTAVLSGGTKIAKPNDNKWTGSQTLHTLSYHSTGSLSPLYVRNVYGQYNPNPYLNLSDPIPGDIIPLIPISGNLNSLICPIVLTSTGGADRALLLKIAGDSIVPPVYDASTRWMLKQSLYQHLKEDPALISTEPLLTQFQNFNAIDNIGKLDHVEEILSRPSLQTPAALTGIKSENLSVNPSNDAESNHKWLNDVLIDNSIAVIHFTNSQLSDLRLLAAKCPYNDGQSVYKARAILSQYEDIEYSNQCESAQLQAQRSMTIQENKNESEAAEYKLYPNPNIGEMNFVYSLDETSNGELNLYDLTGKLINKYVLKSGKNNQLFIQNNDLNNGVYFYKVIVNGQLKASDKIVIIK